MLFAIRACPTGVRLLAQVKVRAASEEDFRAWEGWCHSRFRQLIMLCQPMVRLRAALPACSAPAVASVCDQRRACSASVILDAFCSRAWCACHFWCLSCGVTQSRRWLCSLCR